MNLTYVGFYESVIDRINVLLPFTEIGVIGG